MTIASSGSSGALPRTPSRPSGSSPPAPSPPSDTRYDAAIRTLFARRPDIVVRGLDRIRAVCGLLGDPQSRVEVIHVTGTNGKTTLARMISTLLRSVGLRVGTYTSPHLQDVRERVHIDGRPISRSALIAHLDALAPVLASVERHSGQMVTFFETLTALAFCHFACEDVDAAVVEVHSGGRVDPTNVALARIAVLGPIGLDHPRLGSRLEEVAAEKAGIVKEGVETVISACQQAAAADGIARAAGRLGARLAVEGRDFAALGRTPLREGQKVDLAGLALRLKELWLPLHGAHQATNAAIALAAAESFLTRSGRALDQDAARAGFAAVRSPGRLELVPRPGAAPVLLDGAHNPDAARALALALRTDFPAFDQRVLVLGMLGQKDVDGVVGALLPAADAIVVTQPPSERAAPIDRIAKAARLAGHAPLIAPDVRQALATATGIADPTRGVVLVTGSLYTVGAARDVLGLGW